VSTWAVDGLQVWLTKCPTPVLLDGGLSTQLATTNISGSLWTAQALMDCPQRIEEAHAAFLRAGSELLITASYQVSRAGFLNAGLTAAQADRALRTSVDLARSAIATTPRTSQQREPLVAASVGPYGAILHDGSEYRGNYEISRQGLRDFHLERLTVVAEAEPDLLALETIPDLREVEVLVELLPEFAHLPATLSCTLRNEHQVSAGQPLVELVEYLTAQVLAIGVNCCDPKLVPGSLERLRSVTDHALIAYPNAGGSWDAASERWQGNLVDAPWNAEMFAGASLVGGCCGTDANDVARLRRQLTQSTLS